MSMDKIAEIRRFAEIARNEGGKEYAEDVEYLLSELERQETKYHIDMNNYRAQVQTWQEQHDAQIVELGKQLERVEQENQRLHEYIEEVEQQLKGCEYWKKILREERDKAIEALKWYAEMDKYDGWDIGKEARSTLKELGVNE